MPTSRVLVDVRVEGASLAAALEQAVPSRVVEREGVPVGAAGALSFAVDRGPFEVRLEGDRLVASVALEAKAELCKQVALLGCVGYARCSPAARAAAGVGLLLDDAYRLPASAVSIPVTRRCTLTALDIDATGELQAEANRQAASMRRRIDASMPDLAGPIAAVWRALSFSVPVGAGACARGAPRAIVQSGPRERGGVITVGVGVEGEVLVESPCRPAPPPDVLPPPRLERGAEPGVDLRVPVLLSWAALGRAVARSLALVEIEAGGEVVHVTDARAEAGGAREGGEIALALTIAGQVCGDLWFDAVVDPTPSGDALALRAVRAAAGERERAARLAPGLDAEAVAAALERSVRLAMPIDVSGAPRRIDRLAEHLLGGDASGAGPLSAALSVAMRDAAVERVVAADEGLAVIVRARGAATVRLSGAPGAR